MISVNGNPINVTIFPDKTSQVWKCDFGCLSKPCDIKIDWNFESEAEIFHLIQLINLLKAAYEFSGIYLNIPYFPYARQDKFIRNSKTFALYPFLKILEQLSLNEISTVDVHNEEAIRSNFRSNTVFINKTPEQRIANILGELGTKWVVYPDKGAATRYKFDFEINALVCEKTRDELTGAITSLLFNPELYTSFVKVCATQVPLLVVDDLCDGGATFVELAKMLVSNKITNIYLYVSHGIFSKGTKILFDAGYKRIFTYDKEVK